MANQVAAVELVVFFVAAVDTIPLQVKLAFSKKKRNNQSIGENKKMQKHKRIVATQLTLFLIKTPAPLLAQLKCH